MDWFFLIILMRLFHNTPPSHRSPRQGSTLPTGHSRTWSQSLPSAAVGSRECSQRIRFAWPLHWRGWPIPSALCRRNGQSAPFCRHYAHQTFCRSRVWIKKGVLCVEGIELFGRNDGNCVVLHWVRLGLNTNELWTLSPSAIHHFDFDLFSASHKSVICKLWVGKKRQFLVYALGLEIFVTTIIKYFVEGL